MEEITNWLSEEKKDFEKGLALFNKHSKNRGLKRLITLKITQERYQAKMISELERLSGKTLMKVVPAKPKNKPIPRDEVKWLVPLRFSNLIASEEKIKAEIAKLPERFTALEFSRLPEEIKSLESMFKETFKKRAFLRNRLEVLPTDEDRKDAAALIIDMTKQITGLLIDINYYKEHSNLPTSTIKEDTIELDPIAVKNDIRLCSSRIAKVKSRLKKKEVLTPKQQAKYDADLELRTKLEKQIKLLAIQPE